MSKASPINILYVIDKMVRAGAQRHLCRLLAGLDRDLFLPRVCCLLYPGPLAEELDEMGIEVFSLEQENIMGIRFPRTVAAIARIVRKFRIDLIHSYLFSANIVSPFSGFLTSIPVITSRRDDGFWKRRRHIIAHQAANFFTARITANSAPVIEYLSGVEGVLSKKSILIENGIDVSALRGVGRAFSGDRSGPVKIGCLGNIRPVKGYEILIRALKKIPAPPGLKLEIGGRVLDRKYFQSLRRIIGEESLEEAVSFSGEISDLAGFFGDKDIFVLPSFSEGFSNALLEAMAAGLPSVATSVGANRRVIRDRKDGLLVSPEDPAALAEALEYLLSDRVRARRLGESGAYRIQNRFSNERMCRSLEGLYSQSL